MSRGLTPRAQAWADAGGYEEIAGHRIFVRRIPGDGPPIVLLHGYPSSSYDWRQLLPLLAGRELVVFDFLGFGLSPKPRLPRYSLMQQADVTEAVVGEREVLLVGHDMGTSVASELMARDLEGTLGFGVRGVFLFNGSMVLEQARLTPAQRALRSRLGPLVARLTSEPLFRAQFRRIFSPTHPLTRDEAADQWSLLAHDGGHRIIDRLTYYLHERVEFAGRWHGALRDWAGRLELGWAGRDPVCVEGVLAAVLALRPAAPVTRWPELGHYPQLEDPATVTAAIRAFADG